MILNYLKNLNTITEKSFILADKCFQRIYDKIFILLNVKMRHKLAAELNVYSCKINRRRIGIQHVFKKLKTLRFYYVRDTKIEVNA